MRLFPHLKRNHRSGNWVYFRRFPTSLQGVGGQVFFERSLRTSDREKIFDAWEKAHREFERAVSDRSQLASTTHEAPRCDEALPGRLSRSRDLQWNSDIGATVVALDLRIEDVTRAFSNWGQRERYRRAQALLNDPTYRENTAVFVEECKLVGACGYNRSWQIFCPPLAALAHELLAEEGIEIPAMHGVLYTMQNMIQSELKAVLEDELNWREYNFEGFPKSNPEIYPTEEVAPNGMPYILIEELIEKYIIVNRKPLKTASKLRLVGRYLNSLSGGPVKLSAVTKDLLIQLQTHALAIPARLTRVERTIPFAQLAAQSSSHTRGRPKLTPQAIQSWFNLLGGCFNWAVKADLLRINPTNGIKPKVGKIEQKSRTSFELQELTEIFSHVDYPLRNDGSKYWLPLIALFTGARLNEIGQLQKDDIIFQPHPFIRITDQFAASNTSKRLKNIASRRVIPVHPALIDLGFLDYVSKCNQVYLFPDLPHGGKYEPTKAFSQWFGRYLHKIGIKRPDIVFHSFRHSFKDECRRQSIPEEIHDALTGHKSSGNVGRSYGRGVPDHLLVEAVCKLYPDLSSRLKATLCFGL